MSIPSAIAQALDRIERARQATGRTDRVALELAVKTRTPDECREAAQTLSDLGQPILLGHNRVQEAKATVDAIREIPGAQIHLIGPLQSNKINQALSCVDAIESIDSVALVEKIDSRAAAQLPVFIEVNVSGEDTKHGCSPCTVPSLIETVATSAHLKLTGFMTVGLNSTDEAEVRRGYAHLRQLRDDAAQTLERPVSELDLSMGMSHDLEWAIAEGATIVRVGTAVFGPRHSVARG